MQMRRGVWIERAVGVVSLALLALTAAWPQWIEAAFGVDPDGGNAALEWALVVVFAVCSSALVWHARRAWRSARGATPYHGRSPGA